MHASWMTTAIRRLNRIKAVRTICETATICPAGRACYSRRTRTDSDELTSMSKAPVSTGRRLAYDIGTFPYLAAIFVKWAVLEAKQSRSNIVLFSIRHPREFEMRPKIRGLVDETHNLLPAPWCGVRWAQPYFVDAPIEADVDGDLFADEATRRVSSRPHQMRLTLWGAIVAIIARVLAAETLLLAQI